MTRYAEQQKNTTLRARVESRSIKTDWGMVERMELAEKKLKAFTSVISDVQKTNTSYDK